MSLPLVTSPEDVRSILKYLVRKPAGASLKETKSILGGELIDGRKLATFQRFGLLTRENEHLKLTSIGRELARASDLDFPMCLRARFSSIPAYNACLEWVYEQNLDQLTSADVGAFWHEHYPDELGTSNERQITERATCFLKFCDGAGLGEFVVGRKGQQTRLDVDTEALEAYIRSGKFADESDRLPVLDPVDAVSNGASTSSSCTDPLSFSDTSIKQASNAACLGKAIFVGHGKKKAPLNQLKTILTEFKIPFKVATDEPNLGRPISEKVAQTMRECNCAILIFSADEEFKDVNGESLWRPSENVVHELGASSLLYGGRIVVLKEDCVRLPTNFRDIGYISFAADDLPAKTMDVLKELIGFGIVKVTT